MVRRLSFDETDELARVTAEKILQDLFTTSIWDSFSMFGVPRGGVSAAFLVQKHLEKYFRSADSGCTCKLVKNASEADVIIDDIVDSGKTRYRYWDEFPSKPFYSLVENSPEWVIFPWELSDKGSDVEDVCARLIQHIEHEDLNREGLQETPKRFAKAWSHWTSGYSINAEDIYKKFGVEDHSGDLIVLDEIPIYSLCEHHLAPFFGSVTIGYVPDSLVLGLSKFSRVVDVFARRLQTQEKLTHQIADSIYENMEAKGVAVISSCRHLCMESRGIHRAGIVTKVSSIRGVFSDHTLRLEFLNLLKK